MHVLATAGHVDHGKSTLVRALTGQEPDRLVEERRRGLSIELGYAWTDLGEAGELAFVDVPGHERFVGTMLAGVGPVPAVLLVVAADDPWMPQTAEHLAAIDALGVRHGVVAVSRSDLADPRPAMDRARHATAGTALSGAPVVAVSARTGEGLEDLRRHLGALVRALPAPDPAADVRLWVDRRFTVPGVGTVVTGTLPAGSIRVGDVLVTSGHGQALRVRGIQSLERDREWVQGVARVALNLAGPGVEQLSRDSVLLTPEAFLDTSVVDVRVRGSHGAPSIPPERPLLHVGSVSVATHCRPLADDLVRLRLERPLPLRVGDRALVRDPGSRQVWGVSVLDPDPPALRRRGAAAARAVALSSVDGPDPVGEVTRRQVVSSAHLRRLGVPIDPAQLVTSHSGEADRDVVLTADGWLVSGARASTAGEQVARLVAEHDRTSPLDPGVPLQVLADKVGLPSPELVRAVVVPPLRVQAGRVVAERPAGLPERLARAVDAVRQDLGEDPFAAPTADRLREVGLDDKGAAAAAKAGLLLRPAPGIVLLPGADRTAAQWLAELPQPFTTSEARVRLGTSRRVALPLLEHLDRTGLTRRLPDDRREVSG